MRAPLQEASFCQWKINFPDHSDPNKHFLRWLSNLVFLFFFSVDFRSWRKNSFSQGILTSTIVLVHLGISFKRSQSAYSHLIPFNFHDSHMREGYFERRTLRFKKLWTQPWLTVSRSSYSKSKVLSSTAHQNQASQWNLLAFPDLILGPSTSQGCWFWSQELLPQLEVGNRWK